MKTFLVLVWVVYIAGTAHYGKEKLIIYKVDQRDRAH
jgi:hypothetical protein